MRWYRRLLRGIALFPLLCLWKSLASPACSASSPPSVTPERCLQARTLAGDPAQSLGRRLGAGSAQALFVVALGGSITYGTHTFHATPDPHDPSCRLIQGSACAAGREVVEPHESCLGLAWHAVLTRRLNEALPPEKNGTFHEVRSHAKPGEGTAYHLQVLRDCAAHQAGLLSEKEMRHKPRTRVACASLMRADVIVVDTVINDAIATSQAETELLVRALRQLPRQPMLYWLVASFRHGWDASAQRTPRSPFHTDRVLVAQTEVLEYYGVAQISTLGAMAEDLAHPQGAEQWSHFFGPDHRHPSAWGHEVLADLVLGNLLGDLIDEGNEAAAAPTQSATLREEGALPPLKYADEKELRLRAVEADLTDPATARRVVVESRGFELREDVVGKPGLIGERIADSLLLQPLPSQRVRAGCELSLTYLISYASMGVMKVSVLHEPGRGSPSAAANVGDAVEPVCGHIGANATDLVVGHRERIDTAISLFSGAGENGNEQVSIAHAHALAYTVPEDATCTWLRVRIVMPGNTRSGNKIKLLRLTARCPVEDTEHTDEDETKRPRPRPRPRPRAD